MQTVFFILNDVDLLQEVLRAWQQVGVRGITVLTSTGMGRINNVMCRDDAPLFPSLAEVLEQEQMTHRTLMSVVSDEQVDPLLTATQQVVGDLSRPNTGLFFTMPVGRVVGGYTGK